MRILMATFLGFMLVGCATTSAPDVRVADVYKRHASDQTLDGVRYTSVRSWRPVSDEGVLI